MERAKEARGERGAEDWEVKCLCVTRDKVESVQARKNKTNIQRVNV